MDCHIPCPGTDAQSLCEDAPPLCPGSWPWYRDWLASKVSRRHAALASGFASVCGVAAYGIPPKPPIGKQSAACFPELLNPPPTAQITQQALEGPVNGAVVSQFSGQRCNRNIRKMMPSKIRLGSPSAACGAGSISAMIESAPINHQRTSQIAGKVAPSSTTTLVSLRPPQISHLFTAPVLRSCVECGSKNLRSLIAEGSFDGLRPTGNPDCDERQGNGCRVGQHMSRVGKQGQTTGENPANNLNNHETANENQSDN